MGYSMKDLENAARNINEHFERKAQERGEALANRIISSTSQGRGLWFIILGPVWFIIFVFSGVFAESIMKNALSLEPPISWLSWLVGYAFATAWYKWGFTIRHPFLSSVVATIGLGVANGSGILYSFMN